MNGTMANAVAVNTFSSNWKKLQESLHSEQQHSNVEKPKRKHYNRLSKKQSTSSANVDGQSEEPSVKSAKRRCDEPAAVEGPSDGLGKPKLSKVVAMDCEYVGVGEDGTDHMVARVSLVNVYGECIYDKYVKPVESVTDYRTAISGIRQENLVSGEPFDAVQKEVSDIIERRILVGHSIHNDLKVLYLSHPKRAIRDTAKYKPFKAIARTRFPSLKKLCQLVLGIRIQEGEHDSICDARAALQLYQLHKRNWETSLRRPRKTIKTQAAVSATSGSQLTQRKADRERRMDERRARRNMDSKRSRSNERLRKNVHSDRQNDKQRKWRR